MIQELDKTKLGELDIKNAPISFSQAEAKRLGYRMLTSECVPSEFWIVNNVCRDMRAGGIAHGVVLDAEFNEQGEMLKAISASVCRKGWVSV